MTSLNLPVEEIVLRLSGVCYLMLVLAVSIFGEFFSGLSVNLCGVGVCVREFAFGDAGDVLSIGLNGDAAGYILTPLYTTLIFSSNLVFMLLLLCVSYSFFKFVNRKFTRRSMWIVMVCLLILNCNAMNSGVFIHSGRIDY